MNKATTLSANITTRSNWHWQDNIWTLGLYGTAVGRERCSCPWKSAPVVRLFSGHAPAGAAVIPDPHLLLCRVYMREEKNENGTLPIFGSFFSGRGEKLITLFYCVTFFPVTTVYGVALINALSNLLVEHLHITALSRGPLSFIVVAALYVVLSKGRDRVVAIMSALALPFAASVLLIAVSLIPGWHLSNLTDTAAEMNATPLPVTLKISG